MPCFTYSNKIECLLFFHGVDKSIIFWQVPVIGFVVFGVFLIKLLRVKGLFYISAFQLR